MAKAMKSVLKKAAKYGAVYVLGFLTAVAVFMATSDPMKDWYSTAVTFNLDTGTHIVDGADVGGEQTAALKYWRDWQYFGSRHKGEELLLPQAKKGVVGAMDMLAGYHRDSAYAYRWWPSKRNVHAQKALHWAREAAKHGSASSISSVILPYYAMVLSPTVEDVALVEEYAQVSRGAAFALSAYYANDKELGAPRDANKAQYWSQFMNTHQGFMPGPVDRPTPTLTESQNLYR